MCGRAATIPSHPAQPSFNLSHAVAIAAYDFAAATRKEKVLLWTTKISCPSRGLALPETLPVMLALAGPNIGRETPKPVSVRATLVAGQKSRVTFCQQPGAPPGPPRAFTRGRLSG